MIGALVEARNAKPPDGPHSQKGEQQESNTYELSHAGTQEMIEDKASEMEAKVMNLRMARCISRGGRRGHKRVDAEGNGRAGGSIY